MIGKERRGEADGQVKSLTISGTKVPSKPLFTLPTPMGPIKVKGKYVSLLIAAAAFATILNVPLVDGVQANRCLAILVFATILWATEVSDVDHAADIHVLTPFIVGNTIIRNLNIRSTTRRPPQSYEECRQGANERRGNN